MKKRHKLPWWKVRLPETHWGFPVSSEEVPDEPARRQKSSGVSLLVAMFVIVVASGFAMDLILASSVSLEMAFSQRDRVKAEYTAKSGFYLGLYALMVDWGVDLFKNQQKQKPSDGPGDWWAALNGTPIGASTIKLAAAFQEQFGLSQVMDADVMQQLELFDGEFTIEVSDESAKINPNFCHKGRCNRVELMMKTLFNCPAEKLFLEKKEVNPDELFHLIKDYVDGNNRAETTDYSDENDPYSAFKPPYQAKNAPFDSVDELKKVQGWDEEVHMVFSPFFTVYPFQPTGRDEPTLNINTVSRELITCLIPESRSEDCAEKVALARKLRDDEKTNYNGAIADILRESYCYEAPTGKDAKSAKNKATWFSDVSTTFRIDVTADVGDRRRRLTAVVQRFDSRQMKKAKTKRSYEILYWKML